MKSDMKLPFNDAPVSIDTRQRRQRSERPLNARGRIAMFDPFHIPTGEGQHPMTNQNEAGRYAKFLANGLYECGRILRIPDSRRPAGFRERMVPAGQAALETANRWAHGHADDAALEAA